jgi:hypothetical protein
MALPPDLCPECGAARLRRAAGCPKCGHLFQDLPGVEPKPFTAPLAAAPLEESGAVRGGGCSSCLLLAAICAGLTLLALFSTWLLVRDDARALFASVQREIARSDLARLEDALRTWADGHGGGLLPSDLETLRLPSGDLHDPWGEPYRYEPAPDGRSARLACLGADQAPGGVGPDADLERLVVGL